MQQRLARGAGAAILVAAFSAAGLAQVPPQADPTRVMPPPPPMASPSGQAGQAPASALPPSPLPPSALPASTLPAGAGESLSRPTRPRVVLDIAVGADSWGLITLELDSDRVPATVENFLKYVDSGFYSGTIFHRVIPGFLLQGGGYEQNRERKTSDLLPAIQNEAAKGDKNRRYTIAMARTREPHSATSQFLINLADNPNLDHPGRDGWGYCVFGRVVSGQEVVDRIAQVPTQANPALPSEKSMPVDPPRVRRAYRAPDAGQARGAERDGGAGIEGLQSPSATQRSTNAAQTQPEGEAEAEEPEPNTDGP